MPVWIPKAAILAIHAELLTEHGGFHGPHDDNALEATLARPQHLYHYGDPRPTLAQLAAAYGFGFARNHVFQDGNKRISLAAMDVFLQLNGLELAATEQDAALTIEALAAGEIDQTALARWIGENTGGE